MTIGVISYGVGASCFLALFLLLLTSWRGRLKGALLVSAVFITLLWALSAALYAHAGSLYWIYPYRILEILRGSAWLAFLLQLIQPLAANKNSAVIKLKFAYAGLFTTVIVLLAIDLFPQQFGRVSVDLSILAHVSLAVCGLALIEQLFRNTRPEQRWSTKFLYLGIGTLFAYDFFLYSDALLFKRIDNDIWYARGLVNSMVAPLIAVSAARNPQWSLDVFVSRRIVMHSASIFGASLYLLIMAGVGYYIRIYGGAWGTTIQLAFLVGVVVLLLAMMFSGQLRARVKVFLSKHFFNYKYDYREEWLKFIKTLSTSESIEPLRERAIRAIAEIVNSPSGALWTQRDNNDYVITATWQMSEEGLPHRLDDGSLLPFLEKHHWIVEFDEYETEPELYQYLILPDWLLKMPRGWIIVPLTQAGTLQGVILLTRPLTKIQINWEDRDLLKTAGQQVANYVKLLDITDALMDARQFEAFNRLSAYVVHDLKNIVAQLSLVVANAARHKNNPAFIDDAIHTVENATVKMNRMLAQLRKDTPATGDAKQFDIASALRDVVAVCSIRPPQPVLKQTDPTLLLYANRDRFTSVMEHLIQNAQEATIPAGKVQVRAYREQRIAVIEVTDDGCGMDERFVRDRLFRPFTTTKGNAGMGIGVYESREFVHALGGTIIVTSQPRQGTTFTLRLPLDDTGEAVAETNLEVLNCAHR